MTKRSMVGALLLCLSCSGAPNDSADAEETVSRAASALSTKDFDVTFTNCAEFAGIGFVPAANARPLVPASYTLAGDATNAVIVVRVSRCASSVVDGHALGETITSQIGINVSGQDTTADINNYTLFYATNQALLDAKLRAAGLKADLTNDLSLQVAGGALSASSTSCKTPSFVVAGSVTPPAAAPVTFIASWWGNGNHGVVRARTVFPAIRFGSSMVTLSTKAGSALARLAGSTTLTFALLDSYNTFAASQLEVRDTD